MAHEIHVIALDYPPSLLNGMQSDLWYCLCALAEKNINIRLHLTDEGAHFINAVHESKYELVTYVHPNDPLSDIDDNLPMLFFGTQAYWNNRKNLDASQRSIGIRIFRNEASHHRNLADIHSLGWTKFSLTGKSSELEKIHQEISASPVSLFSTCRDDKFYIQPFVGNNIVQYTPGKGSFCIFNGNLADKDTEFAAYWLIEHVFNKIDLPLVIVGTHPSQELENAAHVRSNTCLVANPSLNEQQELIKKAQIILTPTFIAHQSGFNFSYLLALGRHLLGNTKSCINEAYRKAINIAETPEQFIELTESLFFQEQNENEKEIRQSLLCEMNKDEQGASLLIKNLL